MFKCTFERGLSIGNRIAHDTARVDTGVRRTCCVLPASKASALSQMLDTAISR